MSQQYSAGSFQRQNSNEDRFWSEKFRRTGEAAWPEVLENKNLHPRVRVDQAVRPLPPKTLSILVGLILKLTSMCITIYKFRKVWTV